MNVKNNIIMTIKQFCIRIYMGKRRLFNPYLSYIKSINKKECDTKASNNILITIIGGAYGHLFEGLFARKAMIEGNNVAVFHCNNYLSYCESIQYISKNKSLRCAMCMEQQKEFIKAFNVESYSYYNFITKGDQIVIKKYINSYFQRDEKEHYFLKTNIDKILYSALQRYYLVAEPSMDDQKTVSGFLHTILTTLVAMDKMVKKLQPKYVLSSHGTYSTWGAVVEYCKSHNIYVITFGQNYNHCGIEFAYDDSYLTGVLNDKENNWKKIELTEKERNRVMRFFDERMGKISDDRVAFDYNKNNKSRFSHEDICKILGIAKSTKIVGLFPNIPWDGQVTGGSVVFPRFRNWIKETINFFSEHQNVVLVIRSHPAELLVGNNAGRETTSRMVAEMFECLPKNIIILPPNHQINSYTLGENSEFGITYSSTVSLELTHLGIPIILCGCPPFKDKGIMFDINSKEMYFELLNKGIRGELMLSEQQIELLYKYTHYFFFMNTMPQTLVEIEDTVPIRYLFNDEEQLINDPVFSEMFRCVDNKLPMDFSGYYE